MPSPGSSACAKALAPRAGRRRRLPRGSSNNMPSLGDAFTRELLDSLPTQHAKMVAISVLARYAGAVLYLPTESKAKRRSRAARHSLNNGTGGASAAASLGEGFNGRELSE